jgi:hypothetical protein
MFFRLELFHSSAFVFPSSPFVTNPGADLFVQVALRTNDSSLDLSVRECFATPTADMSQTSYHIIDDW